MGSSRNLWLPPRTGTESAWRKVQMSLCRSGAGSCMEERSPQTGHAGTALRDPRTHPYSTEPSARILPTFVPSLPVYSTENRTTRVLSMRSTSRRTSRAAATAASNSLAPRTVAPFTDVTTS